MLPSMFYKARASSSGVRRKNTSSDDSSSDMDMDCEISDSEQSHIPTDSENGSETETESNNEDESDDDSPVPTDGNWHNYEGRHQQFQFTGNGGIKLNPCPSTPYDYFRAIVDNEVLDLIVKNTNINAQKVLCEKRISRRSRLNKWQAINREDIAKYFGLLLWMGLHPLPKIEDYWSNKTLYRNKIASNIMSRNKFQLITRFIHFAEETVENKQDRLVKLRPLVTLLERKFKQCKVPCKVVVIDETNVPWRGRLLFRQYIPMKRHKYGVKIFKLTDTRLCLRV